MNMKILLIADEIHKGLYDYFKKERWEDIDLILSAGDLKPKYLSFLVTMINAPLYYVRGNHDKRYEKEPPLGCVDLHGQIKTYQGLKIMGLEGSNWYGGQGVEYKESQMKWELFKLIPKIYFTDKVDIILTHSPPAGIYKSTGYAHKGFESFNYLIEKLKPAYFIHGHIHLSYGRNERIHQYKNTKIINAFKYHILEI